MRDSSSSNLAWSRHLVVAVGVTLLGAVWAYTAWSILDLRGRASDVVRQQAEGLLEISGRAIAREIEIYDSSIRTVSERLNTPILEETNPELRHLALFDRVSNARGYGAIFVLNDRGQSYLDSRFLVPRRLDGADRLYFTVHRDNSDAGLFIGRPWTTRISGLTMIPMSRRLAYADGAFAGVVVGAIELDYFRKMVDRFRGKTALTVALDFTDGNVVVSNPDLAPHAEMSLEPDALGFQTSAQVGDLPLRIIVSVPAETIRAAWMPRLLPILAIAFGLSLAIPAVLLVLKRELTRRVTAEERAVAAQAESERLAATDPLTGLWNRRRFESALELWVKPCERQGWALLILDTDYFKGYNDFYGHSAGDRALQRIAAILADRAAGHGGSAYRIGGEEFAVLVPCTDAEVLVFAEGIRTAVAEMAVPHAQHPKGVLTVSGGLAHGGHMPNVASRAWFNAADEALYAAKHQGRDRICLAAANHTTGASWASLPRRAASA